MTIEQCLTAYLLVYSMEAKNWRPGEAEFVTQLADVFSPGNPPTFGNMWAKLNKEYRRQMYKREQDGGI